MKNMTLKLSGDFVIAATFWWRWRASDVTKQGGSKPTLRLARPRLTAGVQHHAVERGGGGDIELIAVRAAEGTIGDAFRHADFVDLSPL